MMAYTLAAQHEEVSCAKNVLYLEGLGIGGFGSINYERNFIVVNAHQINGRIGISTLNIRDFTNQLNPDIIVPIAVNWLYGNRHKIEIGIGQAITNIVVADKGQPKRGLNLNANFNIGYRYQKTSGGMVIRCGYTPFIEHYKNYKHWAGLSIGYAF